MSGFARLTSLNVIVMSGYGIIMSEYALQSYYIKVYSHHNMALLMC